MKKYFLFIFVSMLMSIGMAQTAESYTGLLVTVPDGSTTYALAQMPKISYKTDTVKMTVTAQLFIADRTTPVVEVELAAGKTMRVQWGTYTQTGINDVSSDKFTSYQKDGRKYFTGGKLVIVGKDDVLYDASGKAVK